MRRLVASLAAAWIAACGVNAFAQDEPKVEPLAGTLATARASGVVTIAYRESSIPFSFLSARGEPIGYSIDLCRKLVEAMSEEVSRELEIRWLPVTPETRIEAIASGRADLECGSTTSNLERAKRVAFSPVIFVSGTKLMVKRGSAIKSFRDLGGKTVVVTAGTTNEAAMRDIARKFKVDLNLAVAKDHAQSFSRVAEGMADAFATDDVLLVGLMARNPSAGKFDVVGEFLSYDPYGLVFRRDDPQFATLVERTFQRIASERRLAELYNKWFLRRLPTGETMSLPISPQLEEFFRVIGQPD